jgi:exodeoxyribonuclease VII large subunit
VTGWLDRETAWLEAIESRPALADPVREIERQAERVDALLQRARMSLDASLARGSDDVAHTRARLLALSPGSTLRRGYAIVQHRSDGVVRAAAEVKPGETLTVRFAADQLTVRAADTDDG